MREAYLLGFLTKLSEVGVDPQMLLSATRQPVGTGPGAESPSVDTGSMSTAFLPGGEPDRLRKKKAPTPPTALTLNQRT